MHSEDMNAAAAFVVDPDTQHLYVGYGRGHLPQAERQKLMTGTQIFQPHVKRGGGVYFSKSVPAGQVSMNTS